MKHAFLLAASIAAAPLFSQNKSAEAAPARAVVVGIGRYQDTAFAPLDDARRDAEEFAAFLQSPPGGRMERDQILLLTDGEATLARFAAALDWLIDEPPGNPRTARRLLYVAGAAQITAPGGLKEDAAIFFHDSPPAPLEGNSFGLHEMQQLLGKDRAAFTLTAALREPFLENEEASPPPPRLHTEAPAKTGLPTAWDGDGKAKRLVFLKKTTVAPPDPPSGHRPRSMSNDLVAALIGLADDNGDGVVSAAETILFLKKKPGLPAEFSVKEGRCFFYLAASPGSAELSKVDARMREDLEKLGGDDLFPPIVHLESMPAEDRALEAAGPSAQRLYEDFILSIKVKNFLPPSPGNAASLNDSLLAVPGLAPIAGQIRRRLAAAMLDETQQALNAYLNNSAKELSRRRRDPDQYAVYAQLLARASALLGPRHYLRSSLTAKQLYFEGLAARLRFLSVQKDTALLLTALEKQRSALEAEPEASYILNELGVVRLNLGNREEARRQFLAASELSPAWGIPWANMSLLSINEKDWAAAREQAIKAVSLAPWNPEAYQILGYICRQSGELPTAERLYLRALRLGAEAADPMYNLACLAALQGRPEEALDWLRRAIEQGFDDRALLAADPDLDSLRNLPGWEAVVRL